MTAVSVNPHHNCSAVAFRSGSVPAFTLRAEKDADFFARERLLDEAFGPARFLKTCEKLRAGRLPVAGLSLVAMRGMRLIGTVRLWHVEAGPDCPALMLGPLAVASDARGDGAGAALMEAALSRAKMGAHSAVLLVGDAEYYERFGFARHYAKALTMPGPVEAERFLGLELVPGALMRASGLVRAKGGVTAQICSDFLECAA